MIKINGYQIFDKIHQSPRSVIYKGFSEKSSRPVIIKMYNPEFPDFKDADKLLAEFSILKKLPLPEVIKPLAVEYYDNSPVLILEDFEGQPLKVLAERFREDFPFFIRVAQGLTAALGKIHKSKVIHKDIKPGNLLINPATHEIKIIDFGASSFLEKENQVSLDPKSLEGTLQYMSPEQTGRMNRTLDYRSDFYSLGVTFYELVCGRLPFTAEDPLELLHAHIAQVPLSPQQFNERMPPALAGIILKLLSKNAEDRYQSAYGLGADLQKCREALEDGQTSFDFELGAEDKSEKLRIPQKLYGRQPEINALASSFNEVVAGQTKMVVISGYSGIGKTMLVNNLQKLVFEKRGYFVKGKFDQFKRNIPYDSPVQAFKELVRILLTESESSLQGWRDLILTELGTNAQLIVNVIPELELLVGKQPPVVPLGSNESQNRFKLTFQAFARIFTKRNNQLVLFLDDLQWADQDSLDFLKLLVTSKDSGGILLVGAYRNNEVNAAHTLRLTLDEIKATDAGVEELFLNPLTTADISQLVADTFSCPVEEVAELAAFIQTKTSGNPFFINEFIKSLYAQNAIEFDNSQGNWRWNLEQIGQMHITDNVIELMAGKIKQLAGPVQELLKIAACLGNTFTLETLAQINQEPGPVTGQQLLPALEAGLLTPVSHNLKALPYTPTENDLAEQTSPDLAFTFIHDRVQQAAYSLIAEPARMEYHLKIGRLLWQHNTPETEESRLFEMVNHFNFSRELLTDENEKVIVAGLNFKAGEKAKLSSAFAPAHKYFSAGRELLNQTHWATAYELSYNLTLELAECEHLLGNTERAEDYFSVALNQAQSVVDKARVYEKKIHFYSNLSRFRDSYEAGREAVKLFNIQLPSPGKAKPLLIYEFIKSKIKLRGKKSESLLLLPDITNPDLHMAIRLISGLLKSAYQILPELCVANAIKIVNLTVTHGHTPENAIAFIVFGGIFQGGVLGQHETGYHFGKLALALNEKFNFLAQKSEVNFVFGYFSNSWKHPAKETEEYFKTAMKAGLETGDFFHTGCALAALCQNMLMRGAPLGKVQTEAQKYLAMARQIANKEAEESVVAILQTIYNLRGLTNHRTTFEDDNFAEPAYLLKLKNFGSQHLAHFYFVNRMQTLFLWGEYTLALAVAQESKKFLKHSIGMFHMTEHYFYYSLILAALAGTQNSSARKKYIRELKANQRKFQKWATECPPNFLHKNLLLQAEIARLTGGSPDDFYHQALNNAKENAFIQNAAIAAELGASYFLLKNNPVAYQYLEESYFLYKQWGATYKVTQLDEHYLYLRKPKQFSSPETVSANPVLNGLIARPVSSGSWDFGNLDFLSVFKAAQTLSSEVVLEKLLRNLIELLVENAGADKGSLIINRNGTYFIEAEYDKTQEAVRILQARQMEEESVYLPNTIFKYVVRTQEYIVLQEQAEDNNFYQDNYFVQNKPKSILCAPLVSQGRIIAVIYLENNLTAGAFTKSHLDVLLILASQAAISIENAFLYENLELKVQERTKELIAATKKVELANIEITKEKELSENLLKNILPEETAKELMLTGQAKPKFYSMVSVMFTDFVGFTSIASQLSPSELQLELNYLFGKFDDIITYHRLEKIKTIGDSYMCAGGVPVPNVTNAVEIVLAALKIQEFMNQYKTERLAERKKFFECRLGIHTGPLVAGVVGKTKYAYDIWGSTVNTASKMENTGEAGKVHITETTFNLIKEYFICINPRTVEAKNQGKLNTYFVDRLHPDYTLDENGFISNFIFKELPMET